MQRIGGNWLAAAAVTMGLSVAAIAAQFGGEKTETSPGKERRPAAKSAKPAKPATPGGAAIAGKVAQPESQLEAALAAPVSLQVDQVPLQDVVDLLRRNLPVPIVWDSKALEEAGINRQRQVSWQLDNLSLQSVLNLVLAEAELDWTLRRDYLLITSPQESQNLLETKVLLCRDLVLSGPNSPGQRGSHPAMPGMGMMGGGMPGMGMGMPSGMPGGMPGMDGGMGMPGGGMAGSMGAMDVGGGQGQGFSSETPERGNLVALIQATIAPESWGDAGGVGSIREYGSGVLVVRQTPRVLREVEQLLRDLRTAVATP